MNLSLPSSEFKEYVLKQINLFFPDNQTPKPHEFTKLFDSAIDRTEFCFKHINMEPYNHKGLTLLSHLHANQYAVFLWFLSNTVWLETHDKILANKLYCLNKALNGFSCSYEAKLPNIFLLFHIVGTVLGKAEYSDFFVAMQGCTVGAHHGKYPKIGKGVSLLPHSSVIGDCSIGDRVSIGINTTVYQQNIPNDTVVFVDNNHALCQKPSRKAWAQQFFNVQI
jgi:serine O-acetyltransferase